MADKKDKKIPEVPHLSELTGVEKLPVSAVGGVPRYVEVKQIVEKAVDESKELLEDLRYDDTEVKERLDAIEGTLFDKPIIAGDAVLVNKKTLQKIAVPVEELEKYVDTHTPIGVVVIPESHDVYGTGECGVMSLLSASLETPDEGQVTNAKMYWGQYQVNTKLPNLDKVARLGTMNGNLLDTVNGVSDYGYMPLMREGMSKGKECPTDPGTWYENTASSSFGYIPSPYLADGSRNPLYYKVDSPSSSANTLSDFAGKANTELLIGLATAQANWKTAESINNQSGDGYSPAACACWRFHTTGTSQGDWYLPACGELGYCASRYDMINTTLSEIARIFGVSVCQLDTINFWSSSESSVMNARIVYFYDGNVNNFYKNYSLCVRPFTRFKIESERPKNRLDETIERVDSIEEAIKDVNSKLEGVATITSISPEYVSAKLKLYEVWLMEINIDSTTTGPTGQAMAASLLSTDGVREKNDEGAFDFFKDKFIKNLESGMPFLMYSFDKYDDAETFAKKIDRFNDTFPSLHMGIVTEIK